MERSGAGAVTRFCASTGVTISSTFKSLSFFERNFRNSIYPYANRSLSHELDTTDLRLHAFWF